MKRHGNLFEKIIDYDNLILAHKNASKGKHHYKEVKKINSDLEYYIKKLQKMLIEKKFTTSKYKSMKIFCGNKERLIHKLPYYPDRIVQHAILQITAPIWRKSFIRDTFHSIPGRGIHDCRKRIVKYLKSNRPKYCLKIDIKKYYPSVDTNIMKKTIRKSIKCKETLCLFDNILDSAQGLPIGNYTSQFLGNVYLSDFDWYIKQELKYKGYFRYCDDIILFSNDKYNLHETRKALFDILKTNFNLIPNNKWQVFDMEKRRLDFVGYVFNNDGIASIRKSISKSFIKKSNAIKNLKNPINVLMSYWGIFKYTKSMKLWNKHINNLTLSITDKYYQQNPIRRVV